MADSLTPEATLLAVDLGVRSGFALFGRDGRLRWYRSQNFGSRGRLRRAVPGILESAGEGLVALVAEGPRQLAEAWRKEAERRRLRLLTLGAERWRARLLLPRQRRSGEEAKRTADGLARRVIRWSGASNPTSLRHDAAEAVLVGLWGALELGWLEALPPQLRP